MKFIIQIFTGILLVTMLFSIPVIAQENPMAQGQENNGQNSINQEQGGSSVWEYRENYVPKKFNPTPEYMVYVDMGILILIVFAGLFFVLKREGSWKLRLLTIAALVYLGLIRGGCICPVGVITNVTMGIAHPEMVGLVTLVIFLVPLLAALIAGRVFCTSGCPLGAVQHLFYKKKKHYKLPAKLNTALKIAPIALLVATIYFALKSSCFLACEIEPYKALFFTGKTWFEQVLAIFQGHSMEAKFLWTFGFFTWSYLIVILIIGFWIPRPFCRFMCPYGVLLGIFSIFSIKPRHIDKQSCIHCGQCQKVCPTQAIVIDRKEKVSSLSNYSCVQCNRCSDVCKAKAIK